MTFALNPTTGAGTVAVAAGSTALTGTGTNFQATDVNRLIVIGTGLGAQWAYISARTSTTAITLDRPLATAVAGAAYQTATTITQTGTDTSLAGLAALPGVEVDDTTHWKMYNIVGLTLSVQGTLTINGAAANEGIACRGAYRIWMPVAATGVLTFGVKTTVGSAVSYKPGLVYAPGYAASGGSNGLNVSAGGRLTILGGTMYLVGGINLAAGTFSTIEGADFHGIAAGFKDIRYTLAAGEGGNHTASRNRLFGGATIVQSGPVQPVRCEYEFAQGSIFMAAGSTGDTVLSNLTLANNTAVDYTCNTSAGNVNRSCILTNVDAGSAIKISAVAAGGTYNIDIYQQYAPTLTDAAGAAIAGAICFVRDTHNGARLDNTTPTFTDARYHLIADKTYLGTSDAAGLVPALTILTANIRNFDPLTTAPNYDRRSLYNNATDTFAPTVWHYAYNVAQAPVSMRQASVIAPTLALFADPGVTLSEAAAQAKLASSFAVAGTTVTVTADSTLDDLYDALKAYKCTAAAANLETPTLTALIVSASGDKLTGYAGWTLLVNAGATLSAGAKFARVYFDTVTNNGTIAAAYSDSTGQVVTIRDVQNRPMSTYVVVNGVPEGGTVVSGTLVPGWVPNATARQIKVQPTDQVRIAAGVYGSRPALVNTLGADTANFVVVPETDPFIDTTVDATTRSAIANSFASVNNAGVLEVTLNRTLAEYSPGEVLAGFARYIFERGDLLAGAMVQANSADLYRTEPGRVISHAPNYKLRMADTDALGANIAPTGAGYQVPLVVYYEDTAGVRAPITVLNAHGAKVETAPWTQLRAELPARLPGVELLATTAQLQVINTGVMRASLLVPHTQGL